MEDGAKRSPNPNGVVVKSQVLSRNDQGLTKSEICLSATRVERCVK